MSTSEMEVDDVIHETKSKSATNQDKKDNIPW